MFELSFLGFRGLFRGLGISFPRGFFLFAILGGVVLVAAVLLIWALGRRKGPPRVSSSSP